MISRYAPLLLGLILGIAVGLVYGWVIRPAELTESSPDALREDYRIDITLMIAQAYHYDGNLERAVSRLAMLNPQHPEEQTRSAWHYAQEHGFGEAQVTAIAQLAMDLGLEISTENAEGP